MMKSIKAVSYPVHFQEKGYEELSNLISNKNYSTLFILADENTFECCYPKFIPNLKTDIRIEVIEIESGEINKNLETCAGVWNAITELGGDRKSLGNYSRRWRYYRFRWFCCFLLQKRYRFC